MKLFDKHLMDPVSGEYSSQQIVISNYETVTNQAMFDRLLEWAPEIIILDEAHMIKNYQAKRTKAVIKLGDRAIHRYVSTGTLILNSVKDVFSVWRFLDKGETFGRNYHVFINKYMEDENAAWSGKPNHFTKLVAKADMYEELTEHIFKKATRKTKAEVLKDLPPLVKVKRTVELGTQQKKYYKEMERDFVTFVQEQKKNGEHSGAVIANLAVTKALRLQQIVTGYVATDDGQEIIIEDNPRLKETRELLEEIVLSGRNKCILWCAFKANYVMLSKLCTELGIEHVFLTGEQSLEEKRNAMDEFNNTDSCRVIIANRRAGGIGINLVAASYSIIYSRNFSLGDELQSEARNHRGGSQMHERITKIDLCARDTIDELVLEALSNKQDIATTIVDRIVK